MNQKGPRPPDAWQWIVKGWMLFVRGWKIWIAMSLICVIAIWVLNMVPAVGALAAWLIGPLLLAGFMYGAREIEQGRELAVEHLFHALHDSVLALKLLALGLLPMGLSLLSWVLRKSGLQPDYVSPCVTMATLFAFCALLYSLPLILFEGREPGAALWLSLQACLRHLAAIIVFIALALVLAVPAVVTVIGLLVYIPMMVCATYTSYAQVLKTSPPDQLPVAS